MVLTKEYVNDNCDKILNDGVLMIPKEFTIIGASSLSELPKGIKKIVIPDSVREIRQNAFKSSLHLENIIIPNSVTKIGFHAFSGCAGLRAIRLPNTLTTIQDGLFDSCVNIKRIFVPDSVKRIKDDAFGYCFRLKSIMMPEGIEIVTYGGSYLFEDMISEDGELILRKDIFHKCKGLKRITIGNKDYEVQVN